MLHSFLPVVKYVITVLSAVCFHQICGKPTLLSDLKVKLHAEPFINLFF